MCMYICMYGLGLGVSVCTCVHVLQIAQIRTQIEAQKLESVKYFAGVALSVVTVVFSVVFGLWRLLK